MTPQAQLIGYEFSAYIDIIIGAVILCLCMTACSIWLAWQKRSRQFIAASWGLFFFLLVLGTLSLTIFIHDQQITWTNNCADLVATSTDMVNRFDHWKIQPGHPEIFSDWSSPFLMASDPQHPPPDRPLQPEKLKVPEGLTAEFITDQRTVPEGLIAESVFRKPLHSQRRNQWAVAELTQDSEAFNRSTKQIFVRWNPVPQATTYRLQWKDADEKQDDWMNVYTGSKPFCVLTVPDNREIALRIRAEDGTPEDDPDFTKIVDALYFFTETNVYVGYVYTMRFVDQEHNQFIVSPISDGNKNGFIDVYEEPSDIGELFPITSLSQYIREHKKRAMDFETYEDQWGKWFMIAEPIWTSDTTMEGFLAIDFRADAVYRAMYHERFYLLCLFVLVMLVYFGAVLLVNRIQTNASAINRLANELQHTVSELTETKQVTDKALHVKTLFLTNMSHEFRTPLNAILGFTEILTRASFQCIGKERGLCVEAIQQIKENGKSLLTLIDNLLSIAGMDAPQSPRLQFVSVHLRNLIFDVVELMRTQAENKSLTLMVHEPQGAVPEWIRSDPAHIRQVLLLLLDNAIKFTQDGSVSIHYGISPKQQSPHTPMLFISVSDTGIGIEPQFLGSVFKPFLQYESDFTRTYGGMGIGLAVAQQTAAILNGNITVESKVAHGSTFTFTFPRQVAQPAPQESRGSEETESVSALVEFQQTQSGMLLTSDVHQILANCQILYVEDTKINQIVVTKQLESLGAMVATADNGQIGIDKIAEREKQGKPFDVILMDMQMPVMDGYEATRSLRLHGYFKPIIAVTAHALPEDRAKTLEAGCDEYVSKPIDFTRLTNVIKKFWK